MARKPQDNPQLDMTPMIDVVFELIIFFVVTIETKNMFAGLNVNRPDPSPASESTQDVEPIKIRLGAAASGSANGVIFWGKTQLGPGDPVRARRELDQNLAKAYATNPKQMIVVECDRNSPHKVLVDVLDYCYKNKLHSVSVFSYLKN